MLDYIELVVSIAPEEVIAVGTFDSLDAMDAWKQDFSQALAELNQELGLGPQGITVQPHNVAYHDEPDNSLRPDETAKALDQIRRTYHEIYDSF